MTVFAGNRDALSEAALIRVSYNHRSGAAIGDGCMTV